MRGRLVSLSVSVCLSLFLSSSQQVSFKLFFMACDTHNYVWGLYDRTNFVCKTSLNGELNVLVNTSACGSGIVGSNPIKVM